MTDVIEVTIWDPVSGKQRLVRDLCVRRDPETQGHVEFTVTGGRGEDWKSAIPLADFEKCNPHITLAEL